MRSRLPPLGEVPRTLLWTLHSRACAAASGALHDPVALRVRDALGPELGRTFGRAEPAFGARAHLFDSALRDFLKEHPGADVVSLGEGLETQRHRVEGYGSWTSVDLPEVITVRDQLLPPGPRHRHLAADARSLTWLPVPGTPTFVVAQGLFMYLQPNAVQRILNRWSETVGGELMFDIVPPWVAALSRIRVPMTRTFRLPQMPWGAGRTALERLVELSVRRPYHLSMNACPLPAGPVRVSGRTWVARLSVEPVPHRAAREEPSISGRAPSPETPSAARIQIRLSP